MEKIKMHKKMAMTGKAPTAGLKIGDTKDFIKRRKILAGGKNKMMGGGMMKPTGYKMGGGVKKPVTVKEITPKGRKGVLIYKGKAKDYKPVGKNK